MDPCFKSVEEKGFYHYSDYLFNICNCFDAYYASDMLQWNGTEWEGKISFSEVDLPPPASTCDSVRAIWMGYTSWTAGGEGFAMKLDHKLESGKTYTFTFTYASDGIGANGAFAPRLLTNGGEYPYLRGSEPVGYLPAAGYEWKTDKITFRAKDVQEGHNWIILYAFESSGIVLSDCLADDPVKVIADSVQNSVCDGDVITLEAPTGLNYKYQWSTGDTTSTIDVDHSGQYTVSITNFDCKAEDQVIDVSFIDCEPHLEMPNVFTPNGDTKNAVFTPIAADNIASSQLTIYNRWGQKVITTDLINGWDGVIGSNEATPGVYYYYLVYWDYRGWEYEGKGVVEMIR
jgi:gliding motility-associated-like protein